MEFLTDDDFFTWQTNHGLMQLLSLGQIIDIVVDYKYKKSLIETFESRLVQTFPYFIGPDGSVYEAASGYWVAIYKLYKKIVNIPIVRDLETVKNVNNEINKVKLFLSTTASNDGFLQGMGDSYSTNVDTLLLNTDIPQNRFFFYSNKLAGATWSDSERNYNILFSTLNTPPNVHKLPEDLAIYLYINQPFFSNTGPFSYNKSMERQLFLTEIPHSIVTSKNHPEEIPFSSNIKVINAYKSEPRFYVKGYKSYENADTIYRQIKVFPDSGISLIDYSEQIDTLITYFNIHPAIQISKLSDNLVILAGSRDNQISITSNNKIEITDGIISELPQELTKIKRLKISGNYIETFVKFPYQRHNNIVFSSILESNINHRHLYANKLKSVYKSANPPPLTIKNRLIIIAIIIFISSLFSEIFVYSQRKRYE